MEGSLTVFWQSSIAICVLVQPKDMSLGYVNEGAHDSAVLDSKSKIAEC